MTLETSWVQFLRVPPSGSNQVVEAVQITDQEGRFGFLVDPGEYYIKAEKPGYVFPSTIKEKLTLYGKEIKVYQGETI
ncbi:unnamed protein product, partial [marine sediment metagenome]